MAALNQFKNTSVKRVSGSGGKEQQKRSHQPEMAPQRTVQSLSRASASCERDVPPAGPSSAMTGYSPMTCPSSCSDGRSSRASTSSSLHALGASHPLIRPGRPAAASSETTRTIEVPTLMTMSSKTAPTDKENTSRRARYSASGGGGISSRSRISSSSSSSMSGSASNSCNNSVTSLSSNHVVSAHTLPGRTPANDSERCRMARQIAAHWMSALMQASPHEYSESDGSCTDDSDREEDRGALVGDDGHTTASCHRPDANDSAECASRASPLVRDASLSATRNRQQHHAGGSSSTISNNDVYNNSDSMSNHSDNHHHSTTRRTPNQSSAVESSPALFSFLDVVKSGARRGGSASLLPAQSRPHHPVHAMSQCTVNEADSRTNSETCAVHVVHTSSHDQGHGRLVAQTAKAPSRRVGHSHSRDTRSMSPPRTGDRDYTHIRLQPRRADATAPLLRELREVALACASLDALRRVSGGGRGAGGGGSARRHTPPHSLQRRFSPPPPGSRRREKDDEDEDADALHVSPGNYHHNKEEEDGGGGGGVCRERSKANSRHNSNGKSIITIAVASAASLSPAPDTDAGGLGDMYAAQWKAVQSHWSAIRQLVRNKSDVITALDAAFGSCWRVKDEPTRTSENDALLDSERHTCQPPRLNNDNDNGLDSNEAADTTPATTTDTLVSHACPAHSHNEMTKPKEISAVSGNTPHPPWCIDHTITHTFPPPSSSSHTHPSAESSASTQTPTLAGSPAVPSQTSSSSASSSAVSAHHSTAIPSSQTMTTTVGTLVHTPHPHTNSSLTLPTRTASTSRLNYDAVPFHGSGSVLSVEFSGEGEEGATAALERVAGELTQHDMAAATAALRALAGSEAAMDEEEDRLACKDEEEEECKAIAEEDEGVVDNNSDESNTAMAVRTEEEGGLTRRAGPTPALRPTASPYTLSRVDAWQHTLTTATAALVAANASSSSPSMSAGSPLGGNTVKYMMPTAALPAASVTRSTTSSAKTSQPSAASPVTTRGSPGLTFHLESREDMLRRRHAAPTAFYAGVTTSVGAGGGGYRGGVSATAGCGLMLPSSSSAVGGSGYVNSHASTAVHHSVSHHPNHANAMMSSSGTNSSIQGSNGHGNGSSNNSNTLHKSYYKSSAGAGGVLKSSHNTLTSVVDGALVMSSHSATLPTSASSVVPASAMAGNNNNSNNNNSSNENMNNSGNRSSVNSVSSRPTTMAGSSCVTPSLPPPVLTPPTHPRNHSTPHSLQVSPMLTFSPTMTSSPMACPYEYILVVDFEATCEEQARSGYLYEIIEFPVVVVDVRLQRVVAEFHRFVRPRHKRQLSDFCRNLTGIRQDDVDSALSLEEVIRQFERWYAQTIPSNTRTVFATDGPTDFREFLFLHSVMRQGIRFPATFYQFIDVKQTFASYFHCQQGKIKAMLDVLNLPLLGRLHSGLDDARNIARIVIGLLQYGCTFCELPLNFLPTDGMYGGGDHHSSAGAVDHSGNNNNNNNKSRPGNRVRVGEHASSAQRTPPMSSSAETQMSVSATDLSNVATEETDTKTEDKAS